MFNTKIVWYGISGYTIGIGYCIIIESLTRNKWDDYYKNHRYGLFMTPLKPGVIDCFVALPSIMGASIGMFTGYYLR